MQGNERRGACCCTHSGATSTPRPSAGSDELTGRYHPTWHNWLPRRRNGRGCTPRVMARRAGNAPPPHNLRRWRIVSDRCGTTPLARGHGRRLAIPVWILRLVLCRWYEVVEQRGDAEADERCHARGGAELTAKHQDDHQSSD